MGIGNTKTAGLVATTFLVGVLVSACGGGSSGSSVDAGSTQPPPPPINSSLADLQHTETFNLASALMSLDLSPLGQGSNHVFASGNISSATTLTYNAGSDSFSLSINQSDVAYSQTFSPSDIDAGQTNASFTVYDKSGDVLIYLNPHAPLLDFEYVTLGAWVSEDASSQRDLTLGYAVGGIQTADSDMPSTGTATYAGEIAGTGITKPLGVLYLLAGTIDIEANFLNGNIDSTVTALKTDYLTGQVYAPYLFESKGTISAGTNLFGGTITSLDGRNLSGRLDGAFFGPAAVEVGGTFQASNSSDDMVGNFIASSGP